ncbi:MAG: HD domain-containing protein [Flavobacteriaceae bacterium]|nr:HD domain-containing protein [Flavobacteriaceae bacterium]
MIRNNKLKIVNDPIYGFITIPSELVYNLIEHPYFQRLRRISQMGMSYLVYPGAHHTRFHHALGAMFLMQRAVQVLRSKGVEISEIEAQDLYIAILLHDIGHGPFSHALENSIVEGISHEELSLLFMNLLNEEFNGKLEGAIKIFKKECPRKFMHQLVSGQLDMDRLDYLRRDSFYTGVTEGNVSSQRLIAMLDVHNDSLVVEEKGIYSVEKFIVARRFMYWQVYLHKTSLAAEQLVLGVLKRAKDLSLKGEKLPASAALSYFLNKIVHKADFSSETLAVFARLDDVDVLAALKAWEYHNDVVLSQISKMLLHRKLLKVKISNQPFSEEKLKEKRVAFMVKHNLSLEEASYFVFTGEISNQAYRMDKENIFLLKKNGKLKDVAKASDQLNIEALSKTVVKHYLCYPKLE